MLTSGYLIQVSEERYKQSSFVTDLATYEYVSDNNDPLVNPMQKTSLQVQSTAHNWTLI